MKDCIIKKHYQSKRNPEVNQTVYLKKFHGGEIIRGDWTEDETEAYLFDRMTHAKAICKGMKLDGLSLIIKDK